MLRIHLNQHWFNMADEAMEAALCDSAAPRSSICLDLGCEPVHDATRLLRDRGLHLSRGAIVDATAIAPPNSTKNAEQRRDPEMKSTRKRNRWHLGMKVQMSADAKVGLVQVPVLTSANAHDKDAMPDLLRRDKARAYGDRGYHGYTGQF